MPSKNTIREFAPENYYHIYNRGVAKQPIFLDAKDKYYFLKLLARYLDPNNDEVRSDGIPYDKFNLELLCYCLMRNHFHLLVYQLDDADSITKLMRSVSTSYAMYFNEKYNRVGPIFQGRFKASRIDNEAYLSHISRYIHLNPRTYITYKWSSLPSFIKHQKTNWLHPERILELSPTPYLNFLEDYRSKQDELEKFGNIFTI